MDKLDVARIRPPQSVLGLLPPRVARGLGALPVSVAPDGAVTVCVSDATDFALRDRLERLLEGRAVRFAEAGDPTAFAAALRENYPDAALNGTLDRPEELFAYMLRRALARGASDIHVSPDERGSRIRLRVDGRLVTDRREPPEAAAEFVSYIKVQAKLDIAERRAPQDGNIDTELDGATVSLRVATVPTLYGEHVTLRLLSQTARTQKLERLEDLGMHSEAFALFRKALRAPNGVIIISGPTGSGKTTTLYAALRALAAPDDRHLVSIEDPVE
ncbi:MAG TPA: Flp pilus assembly complex ATPase component TadA, partial [Candidatus Spyradenecus faecavium]|nr:Flp pilus assembly complex ATPase component TadA [Candidatus Spyradenecus faecavium]